MPELLPGLTETDLMNTNHAPTHETATNNFSKEIAQLTSNTQQLSLTPTSSNPTEPTIVTQDRFSPKDIPLAGDKVIPNPPFTLLNYYTWLT